MKIRFHLVDILEIALLSPHSPSLSMSKATTQIETVNQIRSGGHFCDHITLSGLCRQSTVALTSSSFVPSVLLFNQ